MTAPEPHNPPVSRRAARLQRERELERAHAMQIPSGVAPESELDRAPEPALAVAPESPRIAASEPSVQTVPLPVIDVTTTPAGPNAGSTPPIFRPPPPDPIRAREPESMETHPLTPIRVGARARRFTAAPTRRAEKTAQLMNPPAAPARHVRPVRLLRLGAVAGLAVVATLVMGSAATVTAAVTGQPLFGTAVASTTERIEEKVASSPEARLVPMPAPAQFIPAPTVEAAPAAVDLCAMPAFTAALAAGDDAAAIAAAGGAETFRTAVAGAMAPCVALDDPGRVWVVLNKLRPSTPLDYRPASLAMPEGVRSVEGGSLRSDAAAALTAMVGAAAGAGVGEIALESGFRSYATQVNTYGSQVDAHGVELADLSSARPGHSEHQSGLAGDLVACAEVCGTMDDLAVTAQGQWLVAHAWEFGWITRYEAGFTPITGYSPEPWHLRYIGPELARAYHDGGWHTLEEFFGLPPAPGYAQ